ncbi:uncharacterized protein F4807DRAFT_422017 [Annulohypoxylon truncatum]|uniref:uncharacterized protein n=1 Tax=Annulohypoxylon truncatum TaxID=327061 RepID=UPI0020075E78|nr:uncharacterized protein F4807DRAFT_422017 [Annulohypoxylon truncatum]KAI1210610.1 hypothetical protein F4807DRAFT_422017 [Annulohypoxylon truncatum]
MTSSLLPPSTRRKLDESIPPLLRPLIRAYVLGYASAVAPRLLTLVLQYVTRRRKSKGVASAIRPHDSFIASLQRILRGGLELQRFPTFCAALVGGTTLLEVLLGTAFNRLLSRSQLTELTRKRLLTWLSSFISAWLSLRLLQSKESDSFAETIGISQDSLENAKQETIRYAGRTLDLTLFASTRALDVIIGEIWSRKRSRRVAAEKWTRGESLISKLTDPTIFAASSALIMWAWFYCPSKLPKSYTKWINSAASVDSRLIEALRRCRSGELIYGKETGQAGLLQSMCADFKWPLDWGDPVKAIPFPCEIVHMGCGPNCEHHALSRFYRSFQWAMATYLPVNLFTQKRDVKGIKAAVISAARSSSFLAAFIALFYYGVCLARTRIGPHVIGKDAQARQKIDSGVCVGSGCFLCGWSVLIEKAARRKELALFVAPRAMATLLPRKYSMDKQWRETFVFAFSTAVVFTCVRENPQRLRGVLGKVLGFVMEAQPR